MQFVTFRRVVLAMLLLGATTVLTLNWVKYKNLWFNWFLGYVSNVCINFGTIVHIKNTLVGWVKRGRADPTISTTYSQCLLLGITILQYVIMFTHFIEDTDQSIVMISNGITLGVVAVMNLTTELAKCLDPPKQLTRIIGGQGNQLPVIVINENLQN